MSQPAPQLSRMEHQAPPSDSQRMYEDVLVRAMRRAERLVPHDQAFEIAHDVAVELLNHPPAQITGALLQLRIVSRLQNMRSAGNRRAALDRAYLDMRSSTVPAWAHPGVGLEARELRDRIQGVVARMPEGMRQAFLLVRQDELTYKEAAAQLGITVGTIHTQLSRASALLRECVERYHHSDAAPSRPPQDR